MSTLTRRGFFGRLAAVAVGAVVVMQAKPMTRGISLRYIQHYNVTTDQMPRLDVLYGAGMLNASHACRINA